MAVGEVCAPQAQVQDLESLVLRDLCSAQCLLRKKGSRHSPARLLLAQGSLCLAVEGSWEESIHSEGEKYPTERQNSLDFAEVAETIRIGFLEK